MKLALLWFICMAFATAWTIAGNYEASASFIAASFVILAMKWGRHDDA